MHFWCWLTKVVSRGWRLLWKWSLTDEDVAGVAMPRLTELEPIYLCRWCRS